MMKKIQIKDLSKILQFYKNVIENSPDMEKYACWKIGKHPTEEMITQYIQNEQMYALFEQNEILGAFAITQNQDENYHNLNWKIQLKDDEVCVLHILAVNPKFQKKRNWKKAS